MHKNKELPTPQNDLIRTLMSLSGYSSQSLAHSSGLLPSTVSRYLNGKTDIKAENLKRLLLSLGIDLNRLLKKELLCRLNGDTSFSQADEDLIFVFSRLKALDKKTLLNSLLTSSEDGSLPEVKEARLRLRRQAQGLGLRSRRRSSC